MKKLSISIDMGAKNNGLFIAKQTDFTQVKRKQIRFIQDRLNNRPRKSLGFKTPAQVFYARVSKVMAA